MNLTLIFLCQYIHHQENKKDNSINPISSLSILSLSLIGVDFIVHVFNWPSMPQVYLQPSNTSIKPSSFVINLSRSMNIICKSLFLSLFCCVNLLTKWMTFIVKSTGINLNCSIFCTTLSHAFIVSGGARVLFKGCHNIKN